ncbi:hypothetical protein V494_08084 [Pseudogymnoascus sp. VKM F-4513 (FW-928)]|nr:hypothetical protein V494_08084 [Pseudogymnoascus sp. VKM F-4513 (FW-928)]
MRLKRPRHIRRRDEQDDQTPMPRFPDQLVDSPVLEHEAEEEHEDAQRPEDDGGRDFPALPVADPDPF